MPGPGTRALGVLALALAVGSSGCTGGGEGGRAGPPLYGVNYGERIYFRCEDGRAFRASLDDGRGHARVEVGEDVYTLPRRSRSDGREVYARDRMRLTVGPGGQAELRLGPGDVMRRCDPLPSN
jgi:hypothetical protein